ncbi:reverse transcriptase domain-containing protein [Tanacetum coccineum]
MRTRNSNFPNNSNGAIPRRRNRGRAPNIIEPELRTIVEVAPMAERTMEELLCAPTEEYGEAIVLPEINADDFEIKTNLLQLVQANSFHGYERENPQASIYSFKRITSTLRFRDVPNYVIKLMMYPYSLEGAAKVWYEKEPPNSILTWEDLVTKFVNQFFPPSKTTYLKNEISRCIQKFEETFSEAWERFKEMLRRLGASWVGNNCHNTDNNQASVCVAMGSYNQVNPQSRVSNQMAPPGLFDANQCGVAYEGPSIPTNPSPKKVMEGETEETTDKEQSNFQGSTAHIPPPVNPILIPEPDLRIQWRRSSNLSRLRYSTLVSRHALLLMPRFAPTIKSLLTNKDKLFELAKIPLKFERELWLGDALKKLPKRKLGD